MDYQIASVILADGRRFNKVYIVGGLITKADALTDISFHESEIVEIRVNHGE